MTTETALCILGPAATVWLGVLYADWRAASDALQEAAWTAALDRYAGRPTRPDLLIVSNGGK